MVHGSPGTLWKCCRSMCSCRISEIVVGVVFIINYWTKIVHFWIYDFDFRWSNRLPEVSKISPQRQHGYSSVISEPLVAVKSSLCSILKSVVVISVFHTSESAWLIGPWLKNSKDPMLFVRYWIDVQKTDLCLLRSEQNTKCSGLDLHNPLSFYSSRTGDHSPVEVQIPLLLRECQSRLPFADFLHEQNMYKTNISNEKFKPNY